MASPIILIAITNSNADVTMNTARNGSRVATALMTKNRITRPTAPAASPANKPADHPPDELASA